MMVEVDQQYQCDCGQINSVAPPKPGVDLGVSLDLGLFTSYAGPCPVSNLFMCSFPHVPISDELLGGSNGRM